MRAEGIAVYDMLAITGEHHHRVEAICRMYRDARWTPDGPQHQGVFYAKSMNELVEHVHIYPQDHSLRACTYAEPEKDSEIYTLPFQRTFLCSDPPYFMIGGEDEKGRFREHKWREAMTKAGLPVAFIERIGSVVQKAIAHHYRGSQ